MRAAVDDVESPGQDPTRSAAGQYCEIAWAGAVLAQSQVADAAHRSQRVTESDRIAQAHLHFHSSRYLYDHNDNFISTGVGAMRAVVRCVLVTIGIAATVATGPAGVSAAAANQPHGLAIASVLPTRGEVVGVAHPVVVTFSAPVADRLATERAIDIKTSPAMTGKYEWLDNDVVQWVPDRFWPAHTTIALSVGSLATSFQTGPAVVGVADLTAHTFTVSIDGVDAGPPSALPRRTTDPTGEKRACFRHRWEGRSTPRRSARTPSWARNAR